MAQCGIACAYQTGEREKGGTTQTVKNHFPQKYSGISIPCLHYHLVLLVEIAV